MIKRVQFQDSIHRCGRLERDFFDTIEYLFIVSIVDPDFVGKPREKSDALLDSFDKINK